MPLIKSLASFLALDGFKRYFFNTSWMFVEQILRLVAGLLVGVYVARYLGPEAFGSYSYAIAFVTLFGAIAKLGLDGIVIRDLINKPEDSEIYLGTAFWLKVIGAVFTICLIFLAIQLTHTDIASRVYILIVAIGLIFQSAEVVDFYFQSRVLTRFVSICRLVSLLCSSILKVCLILVGAKLFSFVMVVLIDQVILALLLMFAYRRQTLGSFLRRFDCVTAKKLLFVSWPLILSGLSISFYMRIDQVMISALLGAKEVGLYSAAVRLSEVWYAIPMILASSLFPAIVNAKGDSEDAYNRRLQALYCLVVWIAIAVAIPVTFLGKWIVITLYGSDFAESGVVLSLHIWTGVFVGLGIASDRWLISEGFYRISMLRTVLGGTVNCALNLLLIPAYGIVGAAVSTLSAQIVAAYLFDLVNKETRGSFAMKTRSFLPVRLYV